jgi:hypothetical protein
MAVKHRRQQRNPKWQLAPETGNRQSRRLSTVRNHRIIPSGSRTVIQRIVLNTVNTAGEGMKKNNNFGERPNEPHREVALAQTIFGGQGVDQSRHHIIPWNTLSAFVRKAYDCDHLDELAEILTAAVTTMMGNSFRYIEGKRTPLAPDVEGGTAKQGDIATQDLTDEIAKVKNVGVKNSSNVSAIETAYCWMPGNLFLGPLNTLRLDDPDEDFEEGAQGQVGGTFENLKTAFGLIKAYVLAAQPTVQQAQAIVALIKPAAQKRFPSHSWRISGPVYSRQTDCTAIT